MTNTKQLGRPVNENSVRQIKLKEIAEKRAIKVYNYRITHFNPIKHGSRDVYMAQVQAEYELECIPEYMRSGGGSKW